MYKMIETNYNNINSESIYNTVAKNSNKDSPKTGNCELDKGLKQKRFNSMPNFVRDFSEGVSF